MKIFLDTLDIAMISKYAHMGIIHGVTTNPTLARRYGMESDVEMISKVHDALEDGEIHVEAFGSSREEILDNAERIGHACGDVNIVFKIRFSETGIDAAQMLLQKGNKTSLHLVYSVNQALLSAAIGSTYICPLAGRLDDVGHDALSNIHEIITAFKLNNETTQIMVSSIRHPQHVIRAYQGGASAVTIPVHVLSQMFHHPLTDHGFNLFRHDVDILSPVGSRNINRNLIVQENDSLERVLSILASHRGGAVAVCRGSILAGIFTTGDLKRLIREKGEHFSLSDLVADYMTDNPVVIDITEMTGTAIEAIKKYDIEQLVVVDGSAVEGLLDAKDLI